MNTNGILPAFTSHGYEMHFIIGFIVALFFSDRKWLWVVLFLAIGKEVVDFFYHGKPSFFDIVFTVFGGYIGSLISIYFGFNFKLL